MINCTIYIDQLINSPVVQSSTYDLPAILREILQIRLAHIALWTLNSECSDQFL